MPLPFFVKGGALALLAATGGAAGDTTIRTVDEPVHRGVATLVEELSIGVADGEEHDMLGEIADIALAPDGSLFALDRQVPVIRHYDAMGRFLGNVGRSGQGPGEYRIVSGIAVDREGRLVVWDTGNWRVSIYAPNGDFLSQWHTSSGTGGSATANYSRGLVVDRDGRVVTRRTLFSRDLSDRPTVWIRYGPDGAVLDTLRAPDFPVPAAQLTAVAGGPAPARGSPSRRGGS